MIDIKLIVLHTHTSENTKITTARSVKTRFAENFAHFLVFTETTSQLVHQNCLSQNHWQFSLIFSVVVSISALLNACILISNAPHLRRLPPSSFLIYWLCAYDSLVVINDLMVSAANLIHGHTNHFPPDTCYLHGFLAMFGSFASLLLCLGLTLFRYLVIIKKTKIRHVWAYLYLV
ncbi:hypothetical protein BJ741DRAFT_117933 [Chytriomyces cf. hyalinus JEL632]|nr:hypothetical protein BJ741DRAFT_117933 [Chytriomyces cf. hyalinus JEL632]